MIERRRVLQMGGAILLGGCITRHARAADTVDIAMRGNADGSKVWFDPIGVHVLPGQVIRWTNRDPGNAHTSTAYHSDNANHARRIPSGAQPWDSEYLLPDQTFSVQLSQEGVYDYFCIPHEMAGMVGRIVVGQPGPAELRGGTGAEKGEPIPEEALRAFPSVEDIVRHGAVRV